MSCSSEVTLFRCISLWVYHGSLTLSHFVSKFPPTRFLSITGHLDASLPSGTSLWNGMFGRVEGQNTTLANTLNQAETRLLRFERAATGISLHVNAHKTEYMCYNQTGDISILDGTSLKLVNKFTYLINRKRPRHTAKEGMDSYR